MKQIKYQFNETLLDIQKRSEREMLDEFNNGEWTFEKPLIKINPYHLNPLAAVILFRTAKEEAITVRVCGKTEDGDLYQSFKPSREHIIPVVGLYPEYNNTVEIWKYQQMESKVSFNIEIGKVEGTTELVSKMETTHEHMQDDMIFLCPAIADLAMAVDYAGDVRLKFTSEMVWDIKQLPNGHFLMGTERLVKMPYFVSGVYEFSMVGKIYREIRFPRGYHHDMIVMPNGDYLALTCNWPNGTDEDQVVLIDSESGAVKRIINVKDIIKPGAQKSGSWSDEDWFHCNALWYDEKNNTVTLSGRHMNAMINFDFGTEELNWIISDPEGWPEEYKDKLFKVKDNGKEFDWQYEQHACLITPHGDVMCFDNHHYGSQKKEEYKKAADSYSRGVQYRIDTKKMEIEQIWQYGKELGYKFYSPYIANVVYYDEGHYLTHSGGIAFTRDGEASEKLGPYAKVDDPEAKMLSTTVETSGDKVLLNLDVHSNYYRGEKVKLYQRDGDNLTVGEPKIIGEMGETPVYTSFDLNDVPYVETGELIPEKCKASIKEDKDIMVFEARFEPGQLVLFILDNGKEKRPYFISTSKGRRGAMCTGTFLPDDDRIVRQVVIKDSLKGKYNARLIIGGNDGSFNMYETGIEIDCGE